MGSILDDIALLKARVRGHTRRLKSGKRVQVKPHARKDRPKKRKEAKYFRGKTDIPFYDEMMANPEYFAEVKGRKFTVAEVTPDEYIEAAASALGVSVAETLRIVDPKLVARYAKKMAAGTLFDLPVIDFASGYQEGRHRALAAKKLGALKIPVVKVQSARERGHETAPPAVKKKRGWEQKHRFVIEMKTHSGEVYAVKSYSQKKTAIKYAIAYEKNGYDVRVVDQDNGDAVYE